MNKTCMILAALALAGCVPGATQGPVYITTPPPEIPVECAVRCQAEPKLPLRDITDVEAAKDRSAFKRAYRCERHYRATCNARLEALTGKR